MKIVESNRMGQIPAYAFDEIKKKVADLKSRGIDVVDLGVGDPARPTSEKVRKRCCKAVDRYADAGYPPYRGIEPFLEAARHRMIIDFDMDDLDAEKEIMATIGSKEAVFHFPAGLINPGDFALIPSPGYPPYTTGTIFAGGKPLFYPLDLENGFLPDLDYIRKVIRNPPPGGKVKIMWVCYPNAPTGRVAPLSFYYDLLEILKDRDVVLASDEAYCDFLYEGEKASPLQAAKKGVIAFYSLSKRSNMTGYRVGWAAGDRRLVNILLRLKTNMDSGTPQFIQEAALRALAEDEFNLYMKDEYRDMRDELTNAFVSTGLEKCVPEGSIYVWQRAPKGMSSEQFAAALLHEDIGVVGIPGNLIANALDDGRNPGEGYVRFSLTCLPERMSMACERIRQFLANQL